MIEILILGVDLMMCILISMFVNKASLIVLLACYLLGMFSSKAAVVNPPRRLLSRTAHRPLPAWYDTLGKVKLGK